MNIVIKNAHENNLKNIDIEIPKNKLIAFTGVSGSGKSTLALDTIQRECQRLYMESLGMTLNIGNKAKVDTITGLSPAISITQHQSNNNPRSTLGSITDLSPYLRVLFATIGVSSHTPSHKYTANHFSYNNPLGACPHCKGMGTTHLPNIDMLIDRKKSIADFAVNGWDQVFIDRYGASLTAAASHYGFSIDIHQPIESYQETQLDLLLYGVLSKQFTARFPHIDAPKTVPEGKFEGVITSLLRRYSQPDISSTQKQRLDKYFTENTCPICHGNKWNPDCLDVHINQKNIQHVLEMSLLETKDWIYLLKKTLDESSMIQVNSLLNNISQKVSGLVDVGVGYLCLNQQSSSLSAGQWQRIKLASVIQSGLTGVLYVLDEPSAGLHPSEIHKIISVLKQLRDLGNTIIVIEHHLNIINAVDHIIDFGPYAGKDGGMVVAKGNQEEIKNTKLSITGKYLVPFIREINNKKLTTNHFLTINNASIHYLKNINVSIPLHTFVSVTGVSGSGKTSLIFDILAKEAQDYFESGETSPSRILTGLENIDNIVTINNQSLSRSSRSNVATYTDLFTDIRNIFSKLSPLYSTRDFSTNTPGGRCEECQGNGFLLVPMHFLPDVQITCPVCNGKRYQEEILNVLYEGYSIFDALNMDIRQALELFRHDKKISHKLSILEEIGLGYLTLGQTTSTLSGGECQRLKLAKELMQNKKAKRLYLFDEPTIGLHPNDVLKVISLLRKLLHQGNSVIVIDHNLSLIAQSDYVIDLGEGGGKEGGEIIGEGTPYHLSTLLNNKTGQALKALTLKKDS